MLNLPLTVALTLAIHPALQPQAGSVETFSFQSDDGKTFDGLIELPPESKRNGYAVVLIGGGTASDRDWTVPADYTTTGAPTRDAAVLAARLVDAGFVVMRWDAIMRDDPIRAKDPNMVTPFPFPETVKHAVLAFEQFKARNLVPSDHVFVIGHSLGARRACHLLEQGHRVAGIVMLAGASLAQTDYESTDLRRLSGSLLGEMDWSGDNEASVDEFDRWKESGTESPLAKISFVQMDRDKDGVLARWELAAQLALNDRGALFAEGAVTRDRNGLPYPEDILHEHPVPVLAVYGTLDNLCVQGVLIRERLAGAGYPEFEMKVYPGLGHCLGEEKAGRTGPMTDQVINDVVRWIDSRRGSPRP